MGRDNGNGFPASRARYRIPQFHGVRQMRGGAWSSRGRREKLPSFRRMLVATARLTRTNEFLLRLDSGMRWNDVVVSHSPLVGQSRLKNERLSRLKNERLSRLKNERLFRLKKEEFPRPKRERARSSTGEAGIFGGGGGRVRWFVVADLCVRPTAREPPTPLRGCRHSGACRNPREFIFCFSPSFPPDTKKMKRNGIFTLLGSVQPCGCHRHAPE